jgi:Ca2+-binding RTX toxin-like protein
MAIINGTPDDDFIDGTPSDDTINGLAGNDGLRGQGGNDLIDGGDDHDFMRGNDGNDIILGGNGDDYLDGGQGDDVLDGGAGWDRISFDPSATSGVTVDLRIQGVAQNTGQGMDTLIGIEHLTGTPFNDTLIGTDGDNWLWGGSDGLGNDGNDIISALGGNDLVEVGHGNHLLDGGLGNDTLNVSGNSSDVTGGLTVSLALQGAAQNTGQGMMNLTGFENLSGSDFNDVLSGDGGDNILAGDLGNDQLSGGAGNDTLYGDGRVTVDTHGTGGSGPIVTYVDVGDLPFPDPSGNDVLNGGKGDDTLWGGGGDDVLTGGKGNDLFGFGPGDGDDRITDFEKNKDTIFFHGISGVDDFGDLTFTKVGNDVLISWGTGDSILLEGVKLNQIHASDFMFG